MTQATAVDPWLAAKGSLSGVPAPSAPASNDPSDPWHVAKASLDTAQSTSGPLQPTDRQANMTSAQVSDDQTRELLLGITEGLGIDPSHPLTSIVKGLVSGAVAIPRLATHPNELRQTVSGMFHAAPDIVDQIHTAYNNGDNAGIANGVGRLVALGGVLYGAGKGVKKVMGPIAEGMGAMPPEAPVGGFGKSTPPVPAHVQNLTEAVGKTNKMFVEDRFNNAVQSAFPSLKASEVQTLGRPVKDLRDVAAVAKDASTKAWKPYQMLLDSTGNIDRLDILRDAVGNIPDEIRNTQASAFKTIVGKYGRDLAKNTYSANEIEQAAQTLNAKLKAYYQKNNLDRASASKLPATAGDEALLAAYRKTLDSKIKADTGYDAQPLRTNYGNIKAVHNAVLETPSGDDTLFDTLTKRPLDVMKPRSMFATTISHVMRQTPDQLAAKAFKSYTPSEPGTSMIHAGWETPTTPESEPGPPIGYGMQTPQPPTPKQLYSETATATPTRTPYPMPPVPPKLLGTGQRMLPAAGDTSVKVTPQPPESFAEALAREQTPQSAQIRELAGQKGRGPYDKQDRPATAEEYLKTKGGLDMPNSPKYETKKPAPPTPPKKGKKS